MTTCEDCARDLNHYNPACLQCGRRYIAAIQARRMRKEEKMKWLRKALADWMAHGHAERDLRAPFKKASK